MPKMMRACLLAVAVMACGSGGAHDGGVDGPGSNSDLVTVAVTLDGAPAPSVQVFFQNVDSTLADAGSAVTDATGRATAKLAAGGFVTVIEPADPDSAQGSTVDTFAAVKPGDVLHVDVGSPSGSATQSVVDLTIPTDPAANVTDYQLYASCSGGEIDITPTGGSGSAAVVRRHVSAAAADNAPVSVTLTGCTGGLADILIISADDAGAFVDFFYQAGVNVGTAGGSGTSVTLTGTYAAVPTIADAVVDAEANTSGIDGQIAIATPRGSIIANAIDVGSGSDGTLGSAQLPIQMPSIPGGTATTTFDILPGSGALDEQAIAEWSASPATALTLDYEMTQQKAIATAPTFAAATHSFAWTLGSVGKLPDGVGVELSAQRAGTGSAGPADWAWRIAAPGSEDGDVALPVLPAGASQFNVLATDQVVVAQVGGFTVPGGYDALRGSMFSNSTTSSLMTGASGTIQLQLYFATGPAAVAGAADLRSRVWRTTTATR